MQFNFDASGIDTSDARNFDPIPKGKYNAMVVESTIKPTKAGTGQYIELVCQIIDGEYTNRKVWWRLNIVNPNKVAEDIGRKELAKLMANLGLGPNIQDTQELHGKPFIIGLKVTESHGYEPSNDVSFTAAANISAPAMAAPAAPQQAAPAAPPWG